MLRFAVLTFNVNNGLAAKKSAPKSERHYLPVLHLSQVRY
jgi:hypothetical protein